MESVSFASPATVSGYWPILSEIDIRPLLKSLHNLGHTVCLPIIVGRQVPLKFRHWSPSDRLQRASFNTFEPNEKKVQIEPEVVIVPLLAFDNKGHRLGYGGGYYDRTLNDFDEADIVTVGVGYEAQFAERVPTGRNDVPLHWIVTEKLSRKVLCRGSME
jgi:5-formyltetrahydrofolate cyclo-ligase